MAPPAALLPMSCAMLACAAFGLDLPTNVYMTSAKGYQCSGGPTGYVWRVCPCICRHIYVCVSIYLPQHTQDQMCAALWQVTQGRGSLASSINMHISLGPCNLQWLHTTAVGHTFCLPALQSDNPSTSLCPTPDTPRATAAFKNGAPVLHAYVLPLNSLLVCCC